jgi:hypothetical protein
VDQDVTILYRIQWLSVGSKPPSPSFGCTYVSNNYTIFWQQYVLPLFQNKVHSMNLIKSTSFGRFLYIATCRVDTCTRQLDHLIPFRFWYCWEPSGPPRRRNAMHRTTLFPPSPCTRVVLLARTCHPHLWLGWHRPNCWLLPPRVGIVASPPALPKQPPPLS